MSPRQQIAQIDKQIDALQAKLFHGMSKNRDAHDCQLRRDEQPELTSQVDALWRQRGFLQVDRDTMDADAARRTNAKPIRYRKCQTCGSRSIAPLTA